ncbi:unnamed protein product, partial [Allacma fusca]
ENTRLLKNLKKLLAFYTSFSNLGVKRSESTRVIVACAQLSSKGLRAKEGLDALQHFHPYKELGVHYDENTQFVVVPKT